MRLGGALLADTYLLGRVMRKKRRKRKGTALRRDGRTPAAFRGEGGALRPRMGLVSLAGLTLSVLEGTEGSAFAIPEAPVDMRRGRAAMRQSFDRA